MNNKTEIVVSSSKYNEASLKFRDAWNVYQQKEELVKHEVINMVTILEKEGLGRTKAIQKIIEDHKDLKGFSRATIYRELPKEVKNDYTTPTQKLSNTKNVSNETFSESQGLKEFREKKGIKEQSANDQIEENLTPTAEMSVMYDTKFVDGLIHENKRLKEENFRLKKENQELQAKLSRKQK